MTPATFSAAVFAERLGSGHSPEWVLTEARAGRIPSRKVGQHRVFTDLDLTDYLEACRQVGPRLARVTRGSRKAAS